MLQDNKRTLVYRDAIMSNTSHFQDKLVLDVGAGSGILTFFAVQAGATHVYAVEASSMADKMQTLVSSSHNDYLKDKISIIHGKIYLKNLFYSTNNNNVYSQNRTIRLAHTYG